MKLTCLVFVYILPSLCSATTNNNYNKCCFGSDELVDSNSTLFSCGRDQYLYNITVKGFEKCDYMFKIANGSDGNFYIKNDGNINIWNDEYLSTEPISEDKYCIGRVENELEVIVICGMEVDETHRNILGYLEAVSAVFLILTALVYAFISELRDLQGKSIISLCGSFGLSLTILSVMQLAEYSDMTLCAIRGFIAYFLIVASFFWMNSISIQIFRSVTQANLSSVNKWEFVYYSVYSWGCAAIMTFCVIIANYVPGQHIKPGIGYQTCWFLTPRHQLMYMFSVLAILVVVNVVIFFHTSVLLWRKTFRSTVIKSLRYKFHMCLRLFVVMGVTWMFEILEVWIDQENLFWVIINIYNALQGFFIFLILVVFRRRAIKGIHSRGLTFCAYGLVERCLGDVDDEENEVINHTSVPMVDQT